MESAKIKFHATCYSPPSTIYTPKKRSCSLCERKCCVCGYHENKDTWEAAALANTVQQLRKKELLCRVTENFVVLIFAVSTWPPKKASINSTRKLPAIRFFSLPIACKPDWKSNCHTLPHTNSHENGKSKEFFLEMKREQKHLSLQHYIYFITFGSCLPSHIRVSELAAKEPFPMVISWNEFIGYFNKTEAIGTLFVHLK